MQNKENKINPGEKYEIDRKFLKNISFLLYRKGIEQYAPMLYANISLHIPLFFNFAPSSVILQGNNLYRFINDIKHPV